MRAGLGNALLAEGDYEDSRQSASITLSGELAIIPSVEVGLDFPRPVGIPHHKDRCTLMFKVACIQLTNIPNIQ
jgi:hypothetical protein